MQGHPHGLEPHRPVRFLGQVIDEPHYTTHRRSRHRDLLAPDFDVRETEGAYFLEGEFPGIADKDSIKLEWVDGRTLSIDARIAKVDLSQEWGVPPNVQHAPPTATGERPPKEKGESSASGAANEGNATAATTSVESEPKPDGEHHKGPQVRDWLCERRTGHYQRTFTFPAEVDISGVKARLGQGLLRVMVPKVKESEIQAKKVPIENVEGLDIGLRA
jgi:HSP20 family molecular chaperone IbpA